MNQDNERIVCLMKIRKTKRRLRKPYKVLLVIMSLFLIFIGGRVAVSMVFDTSDPKYGSINDIETSDSESDDDILAPEMGEEGEYHDQYQDDHQGTLHQMPIADPADQRWFILTEGTYILNP